jgi:alpha-1,3-rhamnosyl/mannosyltransferase
MATVCSIEPRKNLKLLVEVLRILKSRNKLPFPLLVAGGSGWKNSDLFRRVESAGLTSSEVAFLGYLPDIDLPRFYAGAQLFLFSTLYEGFGLPPLEAMASGTPVVASDAPCMPEVLGDAAILRSPGSAEIFADAVLMVLEDEGLRQRLRSAGFVQSQNYRWERSAMALNNVFEEYRSGLVGRNRFVK